MLQAVCSVNPFLPQVLGFYKKFINKFFSGKFYVYIVEKKIYIKIPISIFEIELNSLKFLLKVYRSLGVQKMFLEIISDYRTVKEHNARNSQRLCCCLGALFLDVVRKLPPRQHY
jgi:hypothetical protein